MEGLSVAEEATLSASDVGLFDQAGYSVAINAAGDRVAVGILYDSNTFLYDAGSVHIFERSGTTWSEVATLYAPDAGETDQFGQAVSMSADGTVLLIGCAGDYHPVSTSLRTGTARVFVRDSGGSWSQEAALVPPTSGPDLGGDTIASVRPSR